MSVSEPDDGDLPPDPFGPGDPFPVGPDAAGHPSGGTPGGAPGSGPFSMFGSLFGAGLGSMFGDLANMLASQGPLAWDSARQVALFAATEGITEPNPDPLERIRLDELIRIALPHVTEVGGVDPSPTGALAATTLTRAAWAAQWLEQHRPLLEQLATSLAAGSATGSTPGAEQSPEAVMAGLLAMLGPSLLAMQIGSMAGQLARTHFATYDLPLPGDGTDRLTFVASNIAAFALDWSLPPDSLRMRLVIGELVHHAVMRLPHVRTRLGELLSAHANGFRIDPQAIVERFEGLDPSDPGSMERAMADPQVLIGAVTTPQQQRAAADIANLVAVIEGWCEHVTAQVSTRLLGGDRRVDEALKRRRIEASDGSAMVARLLGVGLDQALLDRGAAFVDGVLQRAGETGLAAVWSDPSHLPTAAELDAPGLWLARIGIDTAPDDQT